MTEPTDDELTALAALSVVTPATIRRLRVRLQETPQTFRVPYGSTLLYVTEDEMYEGCLAAWYREPIVHPDDVPASSVQEWNLRTVHPDAVIGEHAVPLGAVILPGIAWHLIDLDGTVQR